MWRVLASHQGFTSTALAAALTLTSPPVSAQLKLEIGFRSGYSLPFGKLYERDERPSDVSDLAIGKVPIWFDIGARIGKNLFVGGYFEYGVLVFSGALKRQCSELEQPSTLPDVRVRGDCSFHDLRLGAQAQLHLGKPGLLLDPWVGAGIGYEWLSLGMFYEVSEEFTGYKGDLSETLHGFEFLNLQSGLDFRLSDTTAFGPFLAFTVSTYRVVHSTCSGDCRFFDHGFEYVADEAFHHWFFFGVRGSFLL